MASVAAVLLLGVGPGSLQGQTKTIPLRDRFGLFARPVHILTANRVACPVESWGALCRGGFHGPGQRWPKNSPNSYIFNSGLQLAGIMGSDGGPWAGDTAGAFFFDFKGTTQHGLSVTPIYASSNSDDVAAWPPEARVPNDPLYHSALWGREAASEEDAWWLSWEGDPVLNAGRPHPLGVLVETRAMAWNAPGDGIEDMVFFVFRFYNVSSLRPEDYASAPPAMQPRLLAQAQRFHALNNDRFGITLPVGGYTIEALHAAIASDPDVGRDGGNDYASVHLPLGLGFGWQYDFDGTSQYWAYDPLLHAPPAFAGIGLTGIKFLQGPSGNADFLLYSNTENGGFFGAARNTTQLYRYLSGNINTQAGGAPCNAGPPTVTHICFINDSRPFDERHFQSAEPVDLAPGDWATLVAVYIFAAPHVSGTCNGTALCDVPPGDLAITTAMHDPTVVAAGVNVIDTIAGFLGAQDSDGDGRLSQWEFTTAPRSLYGKAQAAQAFFDNGFLTPSAPEAPDFFLIPGDDQVTVMWRPSPSEQMGDPFYQVARSPVVTTDGQTHHNPLYDPNYREFDVEGYRVYRGRVDDPNALELVAQFDYAGRTIDDYGGQVNVTRFCAPELAITTQCPITYDSIAPGLARTAHTTIPLDFGDVIQVRFGDRGPLPDGSAIVNRADTVVVGSSGVPFLLVDDQVRNSFRYFYSVTTFDVNSWQSGPSSLESVRILKAVTPERRASNLTDTEVTVTSRLVGRGVVLDTAAPLPTIHPVTGVFSGPMPPANGWGFQLSGLANQVLLGRQSGNAVLDSVQLGNAWGWPDPNTYWFTVTAGSNRVVVPLATFQPFLDDPGESFSSAEFPAIPIHAGLGDRFGGSGDFSVPGQLSITQPGIYLTNGTGRSSNLAFNDGAENEALWDGSFYDGPRWFSGANESFANPTGGFCAPNCTVTNWNNAGSLPGVIGIHQPAAYTTMNFSFREFQGAMGGASRAADVELHWGAGGVVDSVIDVTHNVRVPFRAGNGTNALGVLTDIGVGASWGFLNLAGQAGGGEFNSDPSNVSAWDFVCLNPFWVDRHIRAPCSLDLNAGDMPMYLEARAALSTLGYVTTSFQSAGPARTAQGVALYINGNIFFFEMTTLPAAGTVWTLRDYVGGIYGGKGTDAAGNIINDAGDYGFLPAVRPLTAVGTTIEFQYDAVQGIEAVTADGLDEVHPVPDPFYFRSGYDDPEVIRFVNLPLKAIIRIYTASGVLVALLEHSSSTFGGEAEWNVRNRDGTRVAPGVYFYHLESNDARRVGRMVVVHASR